MVLLNFLAPLAVAIAPMVQSPSAADLKDGDCIVALLKLQEVANAKDKQGIDGAITFFIGKVIGRSGRDVVVATITQASEKHANSDLEKVIAPLADTCATEVQQSVPTD